MGKLDTASLRRTVGFRVRRTRRHLPIWFGVRTVQGLAARRRGYRYGRALTAAAAYAIRSSDGQEPNPLEAYFDAHTEGPGIWKWRHYFGLYHRHLSRFIGQPVKILEIGIFSGGSVQMWRDYFGDQCHVYGVDIEPACRAYANDNVSIYIGDQADPDFWRQFRSEVPTVDIVIDDGGHLPDQQIATFEALFAHLNPGGVYICEDVGGTYDRFVAYMSGVTRNLYWPPSPGKNLRSFQQAVDGVHFYSGMVVVVKHERPRLRFQDERHGTEWQPFLPHGNPDAPAVH